MDFWNFPLHCGKSDWSVHVAKKSTTESRQEMKDNEKGLGDQDWTYDPAGRGLSLVVGVYDCTGRSNYSGSYQIIRLNGHSCA